MLAGSLTCSAQGIAIGDRLPLESGLPAQLLEARISPQGVEGRMRAEEEEQKRTSIRVCTLQPLQCFFCVSKTRFKRGDVSRVYRAALIHRQEAVQHVLPLVATPGRCI